MVMNAAAAITVVKEIGLKSDVIAELLKTFKNAKRRFAIENYGTVGGIYLKKLYERTRENNQIVVSFSPYDSEYPDALYYPEKNVSFYIGSESDYEEKPINMKRFINEDVLAPYKPRLRAVERLRRDVIKNMYLDYSCIKRLHSELESIYISAMDFEAKEIFCAPLPTFIFTR